MDKDGGNRVQFIERIYNKPSGLKATIGEKRVSAGRGNREPKIMFPRIYYSIPPPSSPLLFLFSRLPGGKRPLGRREGGEERRGEGGSGATRRTTSTTTATKVKNVECLRMWRRQIEVGHSFQIPFAGRNNLHLPPSCPLNRLHGNPPGAHGAETGLEFIISHFHGPLNCIRFRSTIIRLAGHFPSRSLSPSYLSSFPPRIFLLVRRTSLVNFRLKLLF